MPIDNWKPTSEEFEGYTGNAGNTLDRWYHRSAIVIWHRDHHFEVIASSGATDSLPLFCSMAEKLAKAPKKRLEAARIDCIRFARAIIARWPHHAVGYARPASAAQSLYADFPKHLLLLHDRDTISMFLTKLSESDPSLRLSSFVLGACGEFGWNAFAQELKRLFSSRPNVRGRQEIRSRDVEWLSAFCCDKTADSDKSALAHELCAAAVERFCEPFPPRSAYYSPHRHRTISNSEISLPMFLKALAATGCNEGLTRVIHFVQKSPDEFGLDDCQVPCLKSLVPWSKQQFGSVHPQLASWLVAIREKLESATAKRPAAPTDWARPANVDCKCRHCVQLSTFLADPASEVGRIPAREDMRRHLIGMIDQHQCDVKYAVERKGSPFSLVLTKTAGSFERAVKRFEANRNLLDALPNAE